MTFFIMDWILTNMIIMNFLELFQEPFWDPLLHRILLCSRLTCRLMSFPFVKVLQLFNISKVYSLLGISVESFWHSVMRISLAFLNFLSLHFLRRSVIQKYGSSPGNWFVLLCCTQFHLMFYLGRPLPNIYALAVITYAFSCFLDGVNTHIITLTIVL